MKNSGPRPPGRLLVVDDNRVNRLLLAHGLEADGHSVASAEDGLEAMEMIRADPFDLVLLDIEMPGMNGFEVLEALLNDPDLREIPVIMTSASDELDRVVKCIEMGAEDYLTKPLNPILLRARVNASLEKKRLRDQHRELFRTFTTPQVAEELLHKGFTLGGTQVTATAMFADIRSFTTISETLEPADTFEMLNGYFTFMFDAISAHGGTLNQMVGDGIMAVFGAPDYFEGHAMHAILAALQMVQNLVLFNREQAARGRIQIEIGIGIATGQMFAGYTGTLQRAFYTCVGDAVNLAARIEDHTKVAGRPILFDQITREALHPAVQVEALGPVVFKGKQQPVNIYSIQPRPV